ncbi:hypothetical protein AV530_010734 [Patagioenas fasciata monilis]|uniref:Uncharacterized protein n=1 Tax=Patagioenas fasciata monilis TaxID=372326 RepID=A0A1V4K7Q0_PATFA|nr:hypothetical protein AV530_010734 [Patagioenas fasciata monilis]
MGMNLKQELRRESESIQGPWISRLRKGDKDNTSEKPRHISPAGFQGGKPNCLDWQEVVYTHIETFPRTGDTRVQPHAC